MDVSTEPTRADLVALIDWLALPYAGDPVFAIEGEEQSDHKRRLQATWEHVVGTKGPGPMPGMVWARCRTCGHMSVVNPAMLGAQLEAIDG